MVRSNLAGIKPHTSKRCCACAGRGKHPPRPTLAFIPIFIEFALIEDYTRFFILEIKNTMARAPITGTAIDGNSGIS